MKKNRDKKEAMRWIYILAVAVAAYVFGMLTVKYRIFPFQEIMHIKHSNIFYRENSLKPGREKFYNDYYFDKKSFFEVDGSKANIVMIGDSITDRGEWRELFPKVSIANRGIEGDTTAGVLNRMSSICSTNAKKAFIMIGVNDLGKHVSIDEIYSNYEKIVTKLKQHGITPYIESVLCLGDKHARLNKNVLKLNLRLRALSEKENVVFIDLNKALAENGKLKESFSSKDDIHLNGEGFLVWKHSLKKYID